MKQLFFFTGLILIFSLAQAQTDTAKTLAAATVTAIKPFIVQKADKITLNVAASPLAAGGTAYDALLRAPGITDNKGLSFRGRSVLVLIDGKLTNLSGDALRSYLDAIPAGTVDKIEILPNPPARYEAKGETVIDIRTTRGKNLGASGSLTAGAGIGAYGRYNGGASLQYRTQKLSLYGSYDYQHNTTFYDGQSERNVSATASLFSTSRDLRTRNNHSLMLGLDYDLSRKTTVGVLIKGMDNTRNRTVLLNNRLTHTNAQPSISSPDATQPDTLSSVHTLGSARFRTPAVNVYFRSRLDTTGTELSLNGDYFSYNKQWSDHFTTIYQDTKGTEYTPPTRLEDQSPASNSVRSISADLSRPGKFARWQAGLKTTFTHTDNDVRWFLDNRPDTGKTNHFIYQEDIFAAYASATKSIRKFDLNLGLRGTHPHQRILGHSGRAQQTPIYPTLPNDNDHL